MFSDSRILLKSLHILTDLLQSMPLSTHRVAQKPPREQMSSWRGFAKTKSSHQTHSAANSFLHVSNLSVILTFVSFRMRSIYSRRRRRRILFVKNRRGQPWQALLCQLKRVARKVQRFDLRGSGRHGGFPAAEEFSTAVRSFVSAQLRCSRLAKNPAPKSSADAREIVEPR